MAEMRLQRIVMPPRRVLTELYCRFAGEASRPRKRGRRSIRLPRGTILRTDTWFNAFFESYWREYTHLSALVLRLRVSGAGVLRLYRRCSIGAAAVRERYSPPLPYGRGSEKQPCREHLLQEIDFAGEDRGLHVELAEVPPSSGSLGLLYFELESLSSRLVMHQAEWAGRDVAPRPMRLTAGICTYNRAPMLQRNVTALLADPEVAEILHRVIVVDQGTEKVRDHPAFADLARRAAGRLQLVEQDNRGGAGGFTRCLMEAQRTGSASHILLMDDDIIPEPESVLRTAAFLSLARDDLAVGGHMLDRFRPRQLVESGSRFLPERIRIDEPSRRRLDRCGDLLPFLKPRHRHYNGWWFFAFSLSALNRAGLPLPLFLRGDDLEFGCRLMRQGVPSVSLPGVAVWHEPFERKGRSWHAYYELRNLLIVGALHFPIVRAATIARQFFSRVLDELLAYDYYESWLLCEAVAGYLFGPEVVRQPPLAIQQRLHAMGERLQQHQERRTSEASCRVERLLHPSANTAGSPFVFLRILRWWLVLRNLLLSSPSSEAPPRKLLRGSGEQWYHVSSSDVVGVAESHRSHIVVLRRSRSRFIRLLLRAAWLALRLLSGYRRTARHWQASVCTLTSRTFWMNYLNQPNSLRSQSEPRPSGSGTSNRSLTVAARIDPGRDRGDHAQTQDSVLQLD